MGWLGGRNHTDTTAFSLPHSKLFGMLKNGKVFFSVWRDQCGHKNVLFYSRMWLIGCGYENGKVLFLCHTGREQTKTKYFFDFSTWWKSLNEEVKVYLCLYICIHPVSPCQPFRPVAHLWGKWADGAAVAPHTGQKVTWANEKFEIKVLIEIKEENQIKL